MTAQANRHRHPACDSQGNRWSHGRQNRTLPTNLHGGSRAKVTLGGSVLPVSQGISFGGMFEAVSTDFFVDALRGLWIGDLQGVCLKSGVLIGFHGYHLVERHSARRPEGRFDFPGIAAFALTRS